MAEKLVSKGADKSIIAGILKDSNYALTLFQIQKNDIEALENKIFFKNDKPYISCLIRRKDILLKPEEIVRQLYTQKLISHYKYPMERINFEHPVKFGKETKKADIVIFDKDRPLVEYIIVEVKKPKLKDGKRQLKSYCNATGCPIGIWTNGEQISHYNRKDPNYFEDITNIPSNDQTLEDILQKRFTWRNLIIEDKIPNEGKSLRQIIEEMEDEVLANAGVDVFEEVFKLIFTKLFDEMESRKDKDYLDRELKRILKDKRDRENFEKVKDALKDVNDDDYRLLEFRNTGQSEGELKQKIQKLFDKAKNKWMGIFHDTSLIQLSPSHLSICVSSLQDVKLFNSNLQIIDEAFEYLINKSAKGEKGQYFTPRHVIDMCVKMLNPKAGEYVIDPAAGSCGFPVHNIFHVTGHLFENTEIPENEKENVLKVFAIDFDEKAVRVARTLNLIAGDGNTNVMHLNSLDYDRWNETTSSREWLHTYGDGWNRFLKRKIGNDFKKFDFDIVMANPPFAGDIKESRIILKYDLGYNEKGKQKTTVGRDILFVERILDLLKSGGRAAIVLPQGRFNNTNDQYIRNFIFEKCRILAVVGLEVNTFKPHTGTKTSVIFLQKWDDAKCPKLNDYPIFFAVSEKSGKNNSGDYVFLKNEDGSDKLDSHGHFIIHHDLHNHNGELSDGIAEQFIEWAEVNNLSFWK